MRLNSFSIRKLTFVFLKCDWVRSWGFYIFLVHNESQTLLQSKILFLIIFLTLIYQILFDSIINLNLLKIVCCHSI
jgi:hypothetical protein